MYPVTVIPLPPSALWASAQHVIRVAARPYLEACIRRTVSPETEDSTDPTYNMFFFYIHAYYTA